MDAGGGPDPCRVLLYIGCTVATFDDPRTSGRNAPSKQAPALRPSGPKDILLFPGSENVAETGRMAQRTELSAEQNDTQCEERHTGRFRHYVQREFLGWCKSPPCPHVGAGRYAEATESRVVVRGCARR